MIAKLAIREAGPEDLPFLVDSHTRCLIEQAPWKTVDHNWAAVAASLLIKAVLRSSRTLVACAPDDPGQIYGWVAGDPSARVLVWIYVKNAFRGCGVGTTLMEALYGDVGEAWLPIRCCYDTGAARWRAKGWNLVFDSHSLVALAR